MLEIEDLHISFHRYHGGLARTTLTPLHNLDLEIAEGEIVAVVGESGGGKSLLAHAILGLLPGNAEIRGKIRFCGQELDTESTKLLRGKKISLIPQLVSFLNPLIPVGRQVFRAAVVAGLSKKEAKLARDMSFSRVRLGPEIQKLYPFQLSGGMAQRVLVAMATVGGAKLVLADEPTTGLDPERIADFLKLLRMIADEGRAAMLITHDLDAARRVADRIAVFSAGTIVEIMKPGNTEAELKPLHPYSKSLWEAIPANGFRINGIRHSYQPDKKNSGEGCLFHISCDRCGDECRQSPPPLTPVGHGLVRCWHA
ncbi:ABC transporter ATP-binding protein [Desulfolithobacter sp.]